MNINRYTLDIRETEKGVTVDVGWEKDGEHETMSKEYTDMESAMQENALILADISGLKVLYNRNETELQ